MLHSRSGEGGLGPRCTHSRRGDHSCPLFFSQQGPICWQAYRLASITIYSCTKVCTSPETHLPGPRQPDHPDLSNISFPSGVTGPSVDQKTQRRKVHPHHPLHPEPLHLHLPTPHSITPTEPSVQTRPGVTVQQEQHSASPAETPFRKAVKYWEEHRAGTGPRGRHTASGPTLPDEQVPLALCWRVRSGHTCSAM